MAKMFITDYLQKISLLEKHLGAKTNYQILEPFTFNTNDSMEIQAAGKRIANFIGLTDFTFIIATTKQKKNVGGHIDLNEYRNVFIELSPNTSKFPESVLATLAHEITHKYLHIHNLRFNAEYENEIFTDIASVFLGFGKLMLNGCECQNIRKEYDSEATKEITESLKTGYLDRNQIAFVYLLTCAMRNIPLDKYEEGVNDKAMKVLRNCQNQYSYYFDSCFHDPKAKSKSAEYLNSAVRKNQSILSDIDIGILYLQAACINIIDSFLNRNHQRLNKIIMESSSFMNDNEQDPCLRFLNSLKIEGRVQKTISEIDDYSVKATNYQNSIKKLINFMQEFDGLFPKPNSDMFNIIVCRNDGTKLKLPEDKPHLIAKCPKCQYQFIASTAMRISKNSRERKSFTKKIKGMFNRTK